MYLLEREKIERCEKCREERKLREKKEVKRKRINPIKIKRRRKPEYCDNEHEVSRNENCVLDVERRRGRLGNELGEKKII